MHDVFCTHILVTQISLSLFNKRCYVWTLSEVRRQRVYLCYFYLILCCCARYVHNTRPLLLSKMTFYNLEDIVDILNEREYFSCVKHTNSPVPFFFFRAREKHSIGYCVCFALYASCCVSIKEKKHSSAWTTFYSMT